MATIKSYTDINQSKKLKEILPLESADMNWHELPPIGLFVRAFPYKHDNGATEGIFPCWSLAALFYTLPILDNRSPVISKTFDEKYRVVYHSTAYEKAILTSDYDNPIDACVAMIEKLHELNLL